MNNQKGERSRSEQILFNAILKDAIDVKTQKYYTLNLSGVEVLFVFWAVFVSYYVSR